MTRPKTPKHPRKPKYVCQFLIVLPVTDPLVWRRILVPEAYSFWDLHVAIQDAMGWMDSHLHEFEVVDPRGRVERIGIPPDDLDDDRPCSAGWEVPIAKVLVHGMGPMRYRYDFGDDWAHTLELEGLEAADGGAYPRCVAGAGACPPEDVGGTVGYADFLQIIRNPDHSEHAESLAWVGGAFDAHAFDAASVKFDDPRKRWRTAFQEG
jgi:hypothetical protein